MASDFARNPLSRSLAFRLAACAASLLGVLAAVCLWIESPPEVNFVGSWADHLRTPLIADNLSSGNDRAALLKSQFFGASAPQENDGFSAEQLSDQLLSFDSSTPRFVYLSAYATCDDTCKVVLMTEEFEPIAGTDGLLLSDLLSQLDANDAPTLLVLDLDWSLASGPTGLLPNEVGTRVYQQLEQLTGNVLCLVSCSPGQAPTVVQSEGRSTFGYFVETGLQGYADGYQSSRVTDGRVSARELSAYVSSRVSEWTKEYGPTPQTPQLVSKGDSDFLLTVSRPPLASKVAVTAVAELAKKATPSHDAETADAETAKKDVNADENVATYPKWLASAWQQRDRWLASNARSTLPRLIKRFEIELLDSERRWRFGWSPEALKSKFAANTRSLVQEMKDAQELLQAQQAISLAQLEADQANQQPPGQDATNLPSHAEVADAWSALLNTDIKSREPAIVKFRKAIETAPYELVAAAALETLLKEHDADCEEFATVQSELERISAEPVYAEIDSLRQLAERYREHPESDAELLRSFLKVTQLREQAWASAKTVSAMKATLKQADQQRQTAWAILISPDYAPVEQAERLSNKAAQAYQKTIAKQRTLQQAIAVKELSLRRLPQLLPLVRAYPNYQDEWHQATRLARQLVYQLENVGSATRAWDDLESSAADVQQLLNTLHTPLSDDSVAALIANLHAGHIERLPEAEALLATPLLAAEARSALCLATNQAAGLLAKPLVALASDQRPSTIRQWFSQEHRPSQQLDGGPDNAIAIRESQFVSALLKLAGVNTRALDQLIETNAPSKTQSADLQNTLRKTLTGAFAQLHEETSLAVMDRCCRVLPAGRFSSVLDKRLKTPSLLLALQQRQIDRELNAQRFRATSNDLIATLFATETAASLATGIKYESFEVATRSGQLTLSQLSEEVRQDGVEVTVSATSGRKMQAVVFQPNSCLEVSTSWKQSGDEAKLQLTCHLRSEATHAEQASTAGILLQLTDGEQLRHLGIATPRLAGVTPVDLFVEYAGVRLPFSQELHLPPSEKPLPLRLIAVNRTNHRQQFSARVLANQSYTGTVELEPLGEAPLTLAVQQSADHAKAAVPSAVLALANRLEVFLTDAATGELVYHGDRAVSIANPSQYIRVNEARIGPSEGGQPSITLQVERLPGSPTPLAATVAITSNLVTDWPLIQGGRLSANLTADKPSATLQALLAPPVGGNPRLTAGFSINGVVRAMAWTAELPPNGRATDLQIDPTPQIQIKTPRLVAAGQPLPYEIEAAPTEQGCTLEVALCRFDSLGQQTIEWQKHFDIARKSVLEVSPKLSKGNLVCRAALRPQTGEIATTGITGRRTLVALVCDKNGKRLARAVAEVAIDGDPAVAHFENDSTPAVAGAPHKFQIQAHDSLSDVKQVRLFVGAAFTSEPPKGAKLVPAVADPTQPGQWLATLPLPPAVPITTVTAQVTNGVGLSRYVSTSLSLVSKQQASLGKVAGSVTEGTRIQPGLAVELRDADQKPIAQAKTSKQGTFVFDAVKPGKYLVWSTKQQSQRVGAAAVEVKAGATVEADVQLSL